MQVLSGVFNVDLPGDIRDNVYNLTHWSDVSTSQKIIDAVGLMPIIGALKYADEAGDVLKGGRKAADAASAAAKNADEAVQTAVKRTGAEFADNARLGDHFQRHGADFGARTSAEYQAQASRFLASPQQQGIVQKMRPNGDIVRYNPATDEFGVISKNGTIRTYYRPDPQVHGMPSNLEYFNAQ